MRSGKYEYAEPTDEEALSDPKRSWTAWQAQDEATRKKQKPKVEKVEDWLRHVFVDLRESMAELEAEKKKLNDEKTKIEQSIPLTFVMADLKKPRESFVMERGAYDKPGEKVTRSVPSFLPKLAEKTPAKETEKARNTIGSI